MRHSLTLSATVLSTLALAFSALPAPAQNTISTSTTVNAPGTWVVTGNISVACNGNPLIDVQANGVTLDLGGYVLDCSDDSAPLIEADGFANLVIRDGQLQGGASQAAPLVRLIPVWSPLKSWTYRLDGLHFWEFETALVAQGGPSASLTIDDCELVSRRGKDGIDVEDLTGLVIRDSLIRLGQQGGSTQPVSLGGHAIDISGVDLVEIRGTSIYRSNIGINLSHTRGGVISDNTLSANHRGVELREVVRTVVADNAISCWKDCWSGIWIDDGSVDNSVVRNNVLGYPFGLVLISSGNQYSDNRLISTTFTSLGLWNTISGNIDGGRNVH